MSTITTPDITDPPRTTQVSGRMIRIQEKLNDAGIRLKLQALPHGELRLRDVNDRLFRLAEVANVDLHGITAINSVQINDRLRRIEAGVEEIVGFPGSGGGAAVGLPRYGAAVYGVSRYGGAV